MNIHPIEDAWTVSRRKTIMKISPNNVGKISMGNLGCLISIDFVEQP